VDPNHRNAWIHAGDADYHGMTVERGRGFNADQVRHIQSLLAKHDDAAAHVKPYLPNTQTLETLPKMPSRRNGDCDQWRSGKRELQDVGKLPSIMALHRRGDLGDKSKEEIEREMYESRINVQARVHDRSGQPLYGLRGDGAECHN
jgi:hypothetical protein